LNRLATLSADSRRRLVGALDTIWPDALGIFEELPGEAELIEQGILLQPSSRMLNEWLDQTAPYFQNLRLPFPAAQDPDTLFYNPTVEPVFGGRRGQHTPDFTGLWEEMTSVYRLDPEAIW
jgi:ring-1,2-phenylacetyl-CoA epoxidase subunit PaaC